MKKHKSCLVKKRRRAAPMTSSPRRPVPNKRENAWKSEERAKRERRSARPERPTHLEISAPSFRTDKWTFDVDTTRNEKRRRRQERPKLTAGFDILPREDDDSVAAPVEKKEEPKIPVLAPPTILIAPASFRIAPS